MNDADYDLGYYEGIRNAMYLLIHSTDIIQLHEKLKLELADAQKLHYDSRSDQND